MGIPIIENARVMTKGQITIPKEIRDAMKIAEGDRLTFIYDNKQVTVMNANIYAMQVAQQAFVGKADAVGLNTEDDILALCNEVRSEIEGNS
jgi:AbrB family looped-hinge helix DNA binding protein